MSGPPTGARRGRARFVAPVIALLSVAALLAAATPAAARTALAAGRRMHVTVTLTPRDPAALAAYARAVSDPSSSEYRRFLTPAEFGRRFGASTQTIRRVRSALRARGLAAGPVSAGRLSIPVSASAGAVARGFGVGLRRTTLADGATLSAAASSMLSHALAADAASPNAAGTSAAGTTVAGTNAIESVIGLGAGGPQPLALRAPRAVRRHAAAPRVATGGPQPCAEGRAYAGGSTATGPVGYTADTIAASYGFSGLYGAGDEGQGVTIAVYELEPDSPADIAAFQACYGTHTQISYVPVDGGTGVGAGTDEAAFDIENLIGFAPRAKLLVYQGPNSNSGGPGAGPYDTYSAIVNQDRAQVISVSWGECEAQLGRANAQAENQLFEQAAIQGESIVAASGDDGAEDCSGRDGAAIDRPAVDDPSSQPYVTGVGGTQLLVPGPPPQQAAWNSVSTTVASAFTPGASGGGVSSLWPMPAAQREAATSLGVLSAQAAGSHCGLAHGFCREVPDVSADADPTSGYVIYWNGTGTVPGAAAGWQVLGGTSGAAPVWADVLALADAAPACHHVPVGYANPALYRAASTAYASDFADVTTGDNVFTGTYGFTAKAGYSPVTGLGSPNATALVASLCGSRVTIRSIRAQTTALQAPVSLALRVAGVAGDTFSFRALGLPPGLTVNAHTGQISGRPTHAGHYTVQAITRDAAGAIAETTFVWTVTT